MDARPPSSAVHVIRLRDPWDREPVTIASESKDSNANSPVAVSFQRGFGLPTGLNPDDEIDLVVEGIAASGRVWLNQALLGEILMEESSARFSLNSRLQNRNRLLIEFVTAPGADGSLVRSVQSEQKLADYVGEVRLEIISRTP